MDPKTGRPIEGRYGEFRSQREPSASERAAAAELLRLIWGIHVSRSVYVVAELGVADLLSSGPMNADQLAHATGMHAPSLYRVLRLLASLDVFVEEADGSFRLTEVGERLRPDAPASMRSWAMLNEWAGGVRAFEPILETVRTGRPGVDLAHGMPIFDYFARHPDKAVGFQRAMSERTAAFAPNVATAYDFSEVRIVADIGGGTGTLLAAILRAHEHLHGILLDRVDMVDRASEVLEAAGIAQRCQILGGDFFEAVPGGADMYVLANVLHDWDDARAVQILEGCRAAMAQSGRVLIVERLIADDLSEAIPALLSDINMLVVTGGQERTNAQYERLLTGAGLRLGSIREVAAPYGIIEAVE